MNKKERGGARRGTVIRILHIQERYRAQNECNIYNNLAGKLTREMYKKKAQHTRQKER